MTGNFLGIVENVTFAADVSKKEPKFGVLADLSKTELLVYQKRNFCNTDRHIKKNAFEFLNTLAKIFPLQISLGI